MSGSDRGLWVGCNYCHKPIQLSRDNTTVIHYIGSDQRSFLDHLAVYCADRETCPGFMLLFVRTLPPDIIRGLDVVTTEKSYGEPDENVIDLFESVYGFRPHIGNGVPVVKELSLASLIIEAKLAADLSDDAAIAAAIASWTT